MTSTDHEATDTAVDALEVAVLRFSARPPRMAEFLQVLGLSPRVSNSAGTWLELQGERGVVDLHGAGVGSTTDAQPGSTDLVLIARDVTAFAAAIEATEGIEVAVWDEAFGRQATVSYRGRRLTINEVQSDPYGYDVHPASPGPVTVVSHCYESEVDQRRDLLLALGFRMVGAVEADGSSRLESERSAGVIMLHPQVDPADRWGLGLETTEQLVAVADRLRSAGYPAQLDPAANHVKVVDPDGQPVLITARH